MTKNEDAMRRLSAAAVLVAMGVATLVAGGVAQAREPVVDPLSTDAVAGDRAPVGAEPAVPQRAVVAPDDRASVATRTRAVDAKDESIYVLQERSFSKSGKLEVTPFAMTALNPKFVGYLGLGVSAAYHLRENLALEATTSLPFLFYPYYSDLVYEVYRYEQLTPEAVDLKQMTYFGTVSLQFSALYGKLRFYDWILDYDFYASAGAGMVRTLEACNPARADCDDTPNDIGRNLRVPQDSTDAVKVAAQLGGGMRFFFSDALGLRVEVRDIVYADRAVDEKGTSTDIRNNLLLFAGLSLMI